MINPLWSKNGLKIGDYVEVEHGFGVIVNIEYPENKTGRWGIKIIDKTKDNFLIDEGKLLYYFDYEVHEYQGAI